MTFVPQSTVYLTVTRLGCLVSCALVTQNARSHNGARQLSRPGPYPARWWNYHHYHYPSEWLGPPGVRVEGSRVRAGGVSGCRRCVDLEELLAKCVSCVGVWTLLYRRRVITE